LSITIFCYNAFAQNVKSFCRDSGNAKRYRPEFIEGLPFEIVARIPKAKKGRIIIRRDKVGRIVQSKVPAFF